MIAAAAMGDPNASIPTPQPVHYRPMFGAFGSALHDVGHVRVAGGARESGTCGSSSSRSRSSPVKNTRTIGKKRHDLQRLPCREIEVDPETYEVRADGELLDVRAGERAADGAALFPVLMLEITRRLEIDARVRAARRRARRCRSSCARRAGCARGSKAARRSGSCCRAARCCAAAICFVADDGRVVEVVAAPEALLHVAMRRRRRRSRAPPTTSATATCRSRSARAALRLAADHVLEQMLRRPRRDA